LGYLAEFIYIGKEQVDPRKISKLLCKHESFLGSALVTFENGRIDDWMHFFNAPWANFLYYDAFDVLREALHNRFETSALYGALMKSVFESAACSEDDLLLAGTIMCWS
jgi:hypothetical protein